MRRGRSVHDRPGVPYLSPGFRSVSPLQRETLDEDGFLRIELESALGMGRSLRVDG